MAEFDKMNVAECCVVMLKVVLLNVFMLSVEAPFVRAKS